VGLQHGCNPVAPPHPHQAPDNPQPGCGLEL